MGCGASTFNRRCDGDHPAVDSNPSAKKLLVDAAVDEEGRKSISLAPMSPKDNGCFMKEPQVQTMKENFPITKEVKEERPVGRDEDYRRAISGEERDHADEASDKEDDIIFSRSPSFRYYCVPGDDDGDDDSSDEMNAHINEGKSAIVLTRVDSNKSRKDHNSSDAASAKLSSSQTSVPSRKSRKSTARGLRVVLPKGNPATGMKNLLNVTSCSHGREAQAAS